MITKNDSSHKKLEHNIKKNYSFYLEDFANGTCSITCKEKILRQCPKIGQTQLFPATQTNY
jgi:hypothetical protein